MAPKSVFSSRAAKTPSLKDRFARLAARGWTHLSNFPSAEHARISPALRLPMVPSKLSFLPCLAAQVSLPYSESDIPLRGLACDGKSGQQSCVLQPRRCPYKVTFDDSTSHSSPRMSHTQQPLLVSHAGLLVASPTTLTPSPDCQPPTIRISRKLVPQTFLLHRACFWQVCRIIDP